MTSLVIAVLSLLFWLPYVYAKVVRKDYSELTLVSPPRIPADRQPSDSTTSSMAPSFGDDLRRLPWTPMFCAGTFQTTVNTTGTCPTHRPTDNPRMPKVSSKSQPVEPMTSADTAAERTKMESKAEQPDDEASSGQSAEHTPTAANEVPLGAVEKSSPQIEGPWIYPRNLWIIVRYRIPRILTYGLSGKYRLAIAPRTVLTVDSRRCFRTGTEGHQG